jgi:hypothetical protein
MNELFLTHLSFLPRLVRYHPETVSMLHASSSKVLIDFSKYLRISDLNLPTVVGVALTVSSFVSLIRSCNCELATLVHSLLSSAILRWDGVDLVYCGIGNSNGSL